MATEPLALSAPATLTAARRWPIRQVIVYGVAAVCFAWAVRGIHLDDLIARFARVRWAWVAAAVLFDVLSYAFQGLRWRLLLRGTSPVSWFRATQAVYAGLFTNEILPMRLGEGVRALLVAGWTRSSLASVLPSLLVERTIDGVLLLCAAASLSLAVTLPPGIGRALHIMTVGLAAVCLVACASYVAHASGLLRRYTSRLYFPAAPVGRIPALVRWAARFGASLRRTVAPAQAGPALLSSAALLAAQALSLWCALAAFGMGFPLFEAWAVLIILKLGTALPGAPSNAGTFQFACVLGLELFRAPHEAAAAFSIFGFLVLTLPLWALGSLAIARSGTSLGELRTLLGGGEASFRARPHASSAPAESEV